MGVKKEELEPKEILQAVVIADAGYENNFAPLTLPTVGGSPVCLLPLAGRPLLDYTLESLMLGGVKEVILYLTNSPVKVKEWLEKSRWSATPAPVAITVIVNEESRSVGDACRDLDEKGIVRQDFLLVSGDFVSGRLGLETIVDNHKAKALVDKHCIMTNVYIKGSPGHPLRAKGRELIVATDKSTSQVLFYQRATDNTANNFPVELFEHDEVAVMFDLTDPGIAVCSPEVLALFSDNFDLQSLDALTGEILESDLVDSTIYLTTLTVGTAARASDPYMFLTLCRMVLNRWFYPQVPDRPLSGVSYSKDSVYKGLGCVLGKGVVLEEDVMVGHNTVVGERCNIVQTVVGSNCKLGEGCILVNCVLMDGVVVGDGVKLEECLVGEGVIIPSGATVGRRVTLGSGVHLGEKVNVPDFSRISAANTDDWGDGDEEESSGDLGPKAFIYNDDEEDDDDDDSIKIGGNLVEASWWGEIYATDDEDNSSDESSEGGSDPDMDDLNDFSGEESEEEAGGLHEDVKNFRREVIDSVTRGLEQGVATDNLVLEINGSKHAWNITLSEVNQCVLYAVLTVKIDPEATKASLLSAVLANIKKFIPLLVKYSKSKSGQLYYLEGLELLVEKNSAYLDVISKILHALYEADVLDDETILSWSKKTACTASVSEPTLLKKKIVTKIGPFLDWLQEDDSDEESE